MAIPKLKKQDVIDALKFIDENGVPEHNTSVKYVLVSEDGKKYPPKYVVAVADHLANSTDISTESFNNVDAKNYLESLGFSIETKQQEKFELSITAESVESTDERFTMNNLSLGDNYKPLDACFKRANGDVIKRAYSKGERRNSNQTLPRIACQVFEKQLAALSVEDKENFPVCKYNPDNDVIRGIYASVDDFKKHRNTIEYLTYGYDNGRQFVIYCWNIFSTIIFVQECLKRFGEPGDQFILTYREKDEKETAAAETEAAVQEELVQQFKGYRNPFSSMLIESKNLIFRGAPGTGKSYLAKEIAADIISNGYFDDYTLLTDEQKKQVEFVQFHPSYDYSDFVEGLRPKINDDGTMGFELQDGIFKKFVARARKNYEDSQKSRETVEKEVTVQESMTDFFSGVEFGVDMFKTINGSEFTITGADDRQIGVSIPQNPISNKLLLNVEEIRKMLESDTEFTKVKDITSFLGKSVTTQAYVRVVRSLKALVANDYTCIIRINLDENNYNKISDLIKELHQINKKNLLHVFLARVDNPTDPKFHPISIKKVIEAYNTIREISNISIISDIPILQFMIQYNKTVENELLFFGQRSNYCSNERINVFDTNGRIYCCNEAMGDSYFEKNLMGSRLAVSNITPFTFWKCNNCSVFPLCLGNCPRTNRYIANCANRCEQANIEEALITLCSQLTNIGIIGQ